ncbi:MAG: rod-binding protein [Spirochaetota bacterium]
MEINDIGMLQYKNLELKEARLKKDYKYDNNELREACLDFEAIFIKQMLDAMRKTVHKAGVMDGGMAETIFEDMLYDEYAKKISRTAKLGLAEMLYRELLFKNK